MRALFVFLLAFVVLLGCTQGSSGDMNSPQENRGVGPQAGALPPSGGVSMLNRTVQPGDNVKVAYVGTLDDGTVFDQSPENQPLAFTVGAGQVIAGFEEGVQGMKVGETKTITIPPEKAYGYAKSEQIVAVPKAQFGDQVDKLVVGAPISASNGARGKIIAVSDTNVTIDFNHPLAGKTLIFEITLREIVQ